MVNSVRNKKGNVLLQILAATAVMSTSFYFLTNYVIGQKQQIVKTNNMVKLRFAMNSTLDYVIFGVRQKYCFTDDNLLLNSPTDQCNLSHQGSVERLIMSVEQENFIRQLIANNKNVGPVDKNNIRLSQVNRYVQISAVTASHPLFPVLNALKDVKAADDDGSIRVDGVSVTLKRDDSPYLPRSGREVYMRITVALKTSAKEKEPIQIGSTPLVLSSSVVIYPREVGSFALLVPNDLHLDKTWDYTGETGDVSLHMFSSRAELAGSQGLVFQSPVFVNRNVHLPVDDASAEASPDSIRYSPVTFADRLYMGNGWVFSNGSMYSPRSSGGSLDRFWSDARTFGGFLKGIENDGGLDLGLSYFGKVMTGTPPSTKDMEDCIKRGNELASKDLLYKSQLSGRLTSARTNNFEYRMALSNGNKFVQQDNASTIEFFNWGNGTATADAKNADGVVKVSLILGNRAVEGQLDSDGKLTMKAPVGSQEYYNKFIAAVNETKKAYDQALKAYDVLQTELSKYRSDLNTAELALAAEEKKPVKPIVKAPASTETSGSGGGAAGGGKTVEKVVEAAPETEVEDSGSGSSSGSSTTVGSGKYQDPDKIESLEKEISELKRIIKTYNNTTIPNQQSQINTASYSYDKARTDKNAYETLVANPPTVVVDVDPVKNIIGRVQSDRLDFQIKFSNVKSLIDANGNYVDPVLRIQAYDNTFYNSRPVSQGGANAQLLRYLNFKVASNRNEINPPSSVSAEANSSASLAFNESEIDYDALDEKCRVARDAKPSQSFGSAGWNVSFAQGTRNSWNFAGLSSSKLGSDPILNEIVFDNASRSNAVFNVRSIVGKCVIKSNSSFVTGFYACDELVIEARNSPLRIIGTFIVGSMKVHPTALKSGIIWSAIYHPQATRELRAAKVLKSFSGKDCNDESGEPIWHPIPSVQEVADRRGCNTISLRAKADPFQWTSVDPDCGLLENATNTTCKRRLVRFFVVEQSREAGL
ncbi:hypothetical protein EZJ49_09740 [Bdellovibrio bacteriovorus]|uniref:hypothetical protein n=1 Tax=Bdellovibrio bacteriovorus TaxID=959 RepID=UPI0021D2A624|nr:hypothetical protein [Bdellovibrio bacteriovorus]UXR63356.1 hypothetical protein EZJ49_09740 [Bdellovibrio bacteriovorus]